MEQAANDPDRAGAEAAAAAGDSERIVWIGKFLPVYPMFWRYILIGWAVFSAPLSIFFAVLGGWEAVLIINAVLGLVFGASYLYACWLSYRPRGGPECLFAVTPDGAHYHAGPELRNLGQPWAEAAAAATGNLQSLLLMKSAQRGNDLFIPWAAVRSLDIRPALRLVFVSRGLRGPVPLFCTPENFETVRHYALARAPGARVKEARPPPAGR